MNIWIVSEGEPLPIDGEEVRLRRMGQLSNILSDLGHEVHWFSSDFHHFKKETRTFEDRKINVKNNYFIHLLKGNPYKSNISFSRIRHHKKISKKFKSLANKMKTPDIILATMAPLELSETVVDFANSHTIPVVIDIRDLWPEIYREVVSKTLKPLIVPYINYSKIKLHKIFDKSTALVAVTDKFLEYGLEIANRSRKDIDSVFFTSYSNNHSNSSNFLQHWGDVTSDDDFIVSFVGNYGKQFELDNLVTAAKNLYNYTDIKFILCGGGEKYHDLLKETEGYDNIIIKNWVEGDMISSLLNQSSVGIAPYRNSINFRYNLPNKFGEYLSYGLPILVSVKGEMENILNETNTGYYYEDSSDLTNRILELYNNESLLKEMSHNSRQVYKKYFDSDTVYTNMANYLINLAKNFQ